MPAVQLARLKDQIDQLAWVFTNPEAFHKRLHELFETHAERTYRPGQTVRPHPLILSYHVPALVLRQMEQEFGRLCQEHPAAALTLVDMLWSDRYLEPRLLAASLLGSIPLNPHEPVLDRLRAWCRHDLDTPSLEALVERGSQRMRRELPDLWLGIVENWLSSLDLPSQMIGLKAVRPVIQDREFENLPRVFRLLGPLVQAAPADIQSELGRCLEILARRSPAESAYFLRQMLTISGKANTARLIRRSLPAFPEEQQASLRKALINRSSQ